MNVFNPFSVAQPHGCLNKRSFSLPPNEDIDHVFLKRLLWQKTGMPASEDDGQLGPQPTYEPCSVDGRTDHFSGQKRNAQAKRVWNFPGEDMLDIVFD